jgi:hypothetical protein
VSTDDTSVLVTDRIETWKKINLINRDALFIMRKFFSSPDEVIYMSEQLVSRFVRAINRKSNNLSLDV